MYSVLDIAIYFLNRSIDEKKYLTPIQVMKLCYFAHGYKLAIDNQPLVDEVVQAWKYGPVFKDLYQVLKIYGNRRITKLPDVLSYGEEIDADDSEILDAVYESLSDMDGMDISDLTHEEGTPWSVVWESEGKNSRYALIENSLIKSYFEKVLGES
ncbi:PF13274 family protein [Bacteriovorax sp. BSW11_IV]|uniref:Panacea domain-containing protein n=1 Tax=Bacteriovorax sp. BSW11_IV TaxID=1353529 RepID=UPI000389F525|nr:type II toxin-antitoxin system antitoxin SocA domain-containing protein [Bacteriovorax sp. BSW11_IV]EQC44971.1 PF13274 family protein [Bacteriovorax sp. BSW11_IV]